MLFAFDMDGTFLSNDHSICKSNIEAINYLKNKGHKCAIVTGRMHSHLGYILDLVDFDFAISGNGAVIYDCENKIFIKKQEMSTKQLYNLVHLTKKYFNNVSLFRIDFSTMIDFKNSLFVPNLFVQERVYWNNVNNHNDAIFKKVIQLTCHGCKNPDLFEKEMAEKFPNFKPMHVITSNGQWFDITTKNINKGQSINELINKLGLKNKEVYMFGDSANDITALKMFNSVVMGNASKEIKKFGDYIIGKNGTNSILKFVKSLF